MYAHAINCRVSCSANCTAHTDCKTFIRISTLLIPPMKYLKNVKNVYSKRQYYLGLALPWASKSTVGTPRRTKRVNSDCSMFEYFWNAMFLITGGSWWWSPIITHRFRRLRPSFGFYMEIFLKRKSQTNELTIKQKQTRFKYSCRNCTTLPAAAVEWKSQFQESALTLPWECCRTEIQQQRDRDVWVLRVCMSSQ